MKAWSKKETVKKFSEMLDDAKKYYKNMAKTNGMYYSDKDTEVTSEELEMACTIICKLGNVAWQGQK